MKLHHIFRISALVVTLSLFATSVIAAEEDPKPLESVWVSMRAMVPEPDANGAVAGDAKGFGLVMADASKPANRKAVQWDEPNVNNAICIAFDVHNPQPETLEPDENGRVMGWFDEFGNWYDRPQREISVHANGRERINVRSPTEFRTGQWFDVMVNIRYELGGANVVVMIDGQTVIDQMIWDVNPMPIRVMGGAMNGVGSDAIKIKQPKILHSVEFESPLPEPVRVGVFEEALLTNAAWLKSEVDFSKIPKQVGRVVATLTLSEPEVGYDHWDKKGTIGLRFPSTLDDEGNEVKGERFEVFRFITPFRRGWTWHMDVTDLLPLFKDMKEFDAHIGTYMKGWLVSFDLDFYPGTLNREPISVVNLWNGNADIGDTDKPVEDFYVDREIEVPEGTTNARVRATVTGHGMFPNSKNAGEFMPIWRTLTISSGDNEGDVLGHDFIAQSERNHLWKTDVYLNPCRPQGGTWKFDRSGWSPGDKVEPWIVDVQPEFVFGETLTVEYDLDEYINEGKGETWAPHHWTDAVVVFYK